MFKKLFNRLVTESAERSLKKVESNAADTSWNVYSKDRLFDDPVEELEQKRAFTAGFICARDLYKKGVL